MSDFSDLESLDDNTLPQSVIPIPQSPEHKHHHPDIPDSPADHDQYESEADVAEEMGMFHDDF